MERLLALGSVVRVQVEEQATARLMIAGYFPEDTRTGKRYDYVTVVYPFGMQQTPAVQMINHGQILSVEAEGYLDEQAEAFTKELPELIRRMTEEMKKAVAEAKAQKASGENGSAAAADEAAKKKVDPNQAFG